MSFGTKTAVYSILSQHTDLSQYLEKHPGGLNAFNIKVGQNNMFISIFISQNKEVKSVGGENFKQISDSYMLY